MGVSAPAYTDFDKMVRETKTETVIVTTRDATHDQFIIRALEFGCDVISEKPMTTDETKCRRILDAEKRAAKRLRSGVAIVIR